MRQDLWSTIVTNVKFSARSLLRHLRARAFIRAELSRKRRVLGLRRTTVLLPTIVVRAAVVLLVALPAGASWAVDVSQISAKDYYGSAYYQTAQEHPQVQRARSEDRKIQMVARDLGWPARALRDAVKKVATLPRPPLVLAKEALAEGFAASRVQGRVLDVLLSDEEPKHVVLYVRLQLKNPKEAVKDASAIAAVVAERVPLVSTLSLAAIPPGAERGSKDAVWTGKISRAAMERIQTKRIEDYADRLYSGLFEGASDDGGAKDL